MYHALQSQTRYLFGLGNPSAQKMNRVLLENCARSFLNNRYYDQHLHSSMPAIARKNQQLEDEKQELQELNIHFFMYLERVRELENLNGQLLAELGMLKEKWGNNTNKLHNSLSPELKSARQKLDNGLHDQILDELLLEYYDQDICRTKEQIAALENDDRAYRLNTVRQELNQSIKTLETIKRQFEQVSVDLTQQRKRSEDLTNEYDTLKRELIDHRLERAIVHNELQTLREEILFEKAVYDVKHEEILLLGKAGFDVPYFYNKELVLAISEIRREFEELAKSQAYSIQEDYREKMKELSERAEEQQHQSSLADQNNPDNIEYICQELKNSRNEYKQLQSENDQLQVKLNNMLADFETIKEEHDYDKEKLEEQTNQLYQEINNKTETINSILENNTSLRFELITYRSLLRSEEQRLDQSQLNDQTDNSLEDTNESMKELSVKQISSIGSICFDSIDSSHNSIVVKHDASTDASESLENWILRRRVDQQPAITFKFPSSFVLGPGQKVRIVPKGSLSVVQNPDEIILIAEYVDTWGYGQTITTRLIDNNNKEQANITHVCQYRDYY